jgi:hypothetical protein
MESGEGTECHQALDMFLTMQKLTLMSKGKMTLSTI